MSDSEVSYTKLDMSLLRLMKYRKYYIKYIKIINKRAVEQVTQSIIEAFGKYFDLLPECERIPVSTDFYTWFTLNSHYPQDSLVSFKRRFTELESDPTVQVISVMEESLLTAELALKVGELIERYKEGDDLQLDRCLIAAHDDFTKKLNRHVVLPEVEMDDDILKEDELDTGFTWHIPELNHHLRKIRAGDFIIVAARPDKGKTTFGVQMAAHMATQLSSVYEDSNERSIIWLNNEGLGRRISSRLVQSALSCTVTDMIELKRTGTLWNKYEALMGGRRDSVRVLDIHSFRYWQVEELMKRVKPAAIFFDMIDNVRFDGEVNNGGNRTDQLLEAMYQWARELAVIHEVPIIAFSQLSGEAEGKAYPLQSELKDSKTGKQGAADIILTIGATESGGSLRYLGAPKNKLKRAGSTDPKIECVLDGNNARYISFK